MKTTDYSLDELAALVKARLSAVGQLDIGDNHVSPVPDARTTRYYTSIGLLDRPLIVGRQARYTERHLLQLVAIKLLQYLSLPLSTIQSRLYGLSEKELTALIEAIETKLQESRQESAGSDGQFARPVQIWREVVIEPGLKLMVQEDFSTGSPREALLKKIEQALSHLT